MSYLPVSVPAPELGASKWANRRASVRYQCPPATLGSVVQDPREERLGVWVLDLSKTGAGVLLARRLSPDAPVALQISCSTGRQRIEIPARTVHATEQVQGEWLVGLEFLRPLTDAEMDTILG